MLWRHVDVDMTFPSRRNSDTPDSDASSHGFSVAGGESETEETFLFFLKLGEIESGGTLGLGVVSCSRTCYT